MALPFPSPRWWPLLGAALLLFSLPHASAQLPANVTGAAVGFAVVCQNSFLEVDYKGSAQAQCELRDLSRDAVATPGGAGTGPAQHITQLSVQSRSPDPAVGWTIYLSRDYIQTYGNDVVPLTITVQTTPLITVSDVLFVIAANYTGPGGIALNQTIIIAAQVNPYDIAHMEVLNTVQKAGQFDVVRYDLTMTNDGVFPDSYQFSVKGPSDFKMTTPPNLFVPPLSTRNLSISVQTPHDKLYELGRSVTFEFKATSTFGTGVYSRVGVLKVEGAYVPSYWIPLTLVGLVSLAVATGKTRERAERRRLERGRPRRVEVTPRQAVLLAELKRSDPDAYKTRKTQLDEIYRARRERYRDAYAEQMTRDKEERKVALVEFKESKARRKEDAKATVARKALERKLVAASAVADKRERKTKEKELKKAQKRLEKARKAQAKLDAKQAKRDAKAQAKADKAGAKEERAAAKAAKKAAKGGEKP